MTGRYEEAVEYVHSIGEWGSMKLGLDRFAEFCARLDNPQKRFRSIQVAGTNGKGSTVAMISAILRAAGHRVGSYYSPFVYDIRERFLLNGEMIPESDFTRLVERIRPVAEEMEQTEHGHPTEFELKTAIAFLWFAENEVDFAVLETGLGGRLDATTLVTPLVSVITNVSMDHMEHLGDTIARIAAEKAGIIKPDIPAVTAATGEALEVIRRTCEERNSALWWVGPDEGSYVVQAVRPGSPISQHQSPIVRQSYFVTVRGIHNTYDGLKIRMKGDFQHINAALAVGVAEVLQSQNIEIPESAIHIGLESAYLPGRLEIIRERPMLLVDAAHNPDAAAKLVDALKRWFSFDRLILVMGMVKGHSVEDVVSILAPLADKFIATAPDSPRAAPASTVADAARPYCPDVSMVVPVAEAVRKALREAGENDLVCVTGSFYTIGEVPRSTD